MSWETDVLLGLKKEEVQLAVSLPDSALTNLIEQLSNECSFQSVPVAREEEAVGILSGAWLGHVRGALVCQSSGLAAAFNALGSVSLSNRLPFVGIITHRGGLDDHNLAHRPVEYDLPTLLDTIGIRNSKLDVGHDVERKVAMAAKSAFSMEEPYILLLQPGLTAVTDE